MARTQSVEKEQDMSGNDFDKDRESNDKTWLSDKIAGVFDGRDDPNRGPIDRAANVIDGNDDPNRGPIDRAENAIDRNL